MFGEQIPGAVPFGIGRIGHPGSLVGGGESQWKDSRAVGALESAGELGHAARQVEMNLGGLGFEDKVTGSEVRLDGSRGLQGLPVIQQKIRDLGSGDSQGFDEAFTQGGGQRQGTDLGRVGLKTPTLIRSGKKDGGTRSGSRRDMNLALRSQSGSQREGGGFLDDSERKIATEGCVWVHREERQEFHQLLECKLCHAGSVPAAQGFRSGEESFAHFGDLKRALLQQAIEWPASAAGDALEYEHDTPLRNGFIESRREKHMDLEGNPGAGAGKFCGILGPDGRTRRSGRAGTGFLRGRRRGGVWGGSGALDGVESHGDGMGAKGAPLSRGATGTKIIDVDGILDHQSSPITGVIGLDDTAQGGGSPIG